MRNSRNCRTVVTDRDLILRMKIALGQVTNEKSPNSEKVAMVTKEYGNADFWVNIWSPNVVKSGLKRAHRFFGKYRFTSFYSIPIVTVKIGPKVYRHKCKGTNTERGQRIMIA